jgi:hypothetical protein
MDLVVDTNEFGVLTMNGIPRSYLGGFQTIGLGSCVASQYPSYIDDISLSGGELVYIEPPIPTGACCVQTGFGTGSCTIELIHDCAEVPGGVFQGDGSICAMCDFCPTPFGDSDADGDLDQADFAAFQRCITAGGQSILPGCGCFDRNDATATGNPDGSVTADDLADFMNCVTGPAIPFDPQNPPAGCTP